MLRTRLARPASFPAEMAVNVRIGMFHARKSSDFGKASLRASPGLAKKLVSGQQADYRLPADRAD